MFVILRDFLLMIPITTGFWLWPIVSSVACSTQFRSVFATARCYLNPIIIIVSQRLPSKCLVGFRSYRLFTVIEGTGSTGPNHGSREANWHVWTLHLLVFNDFPAVLDYIWTASNEIRIDQRSYIGRSVKVGSTVSPETPR